MEKEAIIEEVAKRIRVHLGAEYSIVLFGSEARGTARERSDIDIGILGPETVPWHIYSAITDDIEEIPTLRKIDVVDLRAVQATFREKAQREGVVLS